MCQPAPLARCANHAKKDGKKLEEDLSRNYESLSAVSEKITELQKEASETGFDESSIMDQDTPGLEDLNKLRKQKEELIKEQHELIRDTWHVELQEDATPKGIEALKKGIGKPGYSHSRLNNAEALNEWQKKIQNLKDSDGNSLALKGGNLEERHKVYLQEFTEAKSEYKTATEVLEKSKERFEVLSTQVARFETTKIGFADPYGRKRGTVVAVNPEDMQEVDNLENQKLVAKELNEKAHYDQILARTKMIKLRKAIQNNRKAQKAKAIATEKSEQTAIVNDSVDTLKKNRAELYEHSKKYMGDGSEEFSRLTSKAYAIETGVKILEKHRLANPGDEPKAVAAFRSEISFLHKEATKKADQAVSQNDKFEEANYRGEQGGLSLLLDKVRNF